MIVEDLMTRNPVSVRPEHDLAVAAQRMWDSDCGALPVMDEGCKVIGMITDRDICMATWSQARAPNAAFVAEAMSRDVIPCRPEDTIARDGQLRLWWDDTPVDLFFNYAEVHDEAARHRRTVPFAGKRIPVLGPVELAIFKVMFDRTRDWADIEAMLAAGTFDLDATRAGLRTLLDAGDHRFARLDDAVRRAAVVP